MGLPSINKGVCLSIQESTFVFCWRLQTFLLNIRCLYLLLLLNCHDTCTVSICYRPPSVTWRAIWNSSLSWASPGGAWSMHSWIAIGKRTRTSWWRVWTHFKTFHIHSGWGVINVQVVPGPKGFSKQNPEANCYFQSSDGNLCWRYQVHRS